MRYDSTTIGADALEGATPRAGDDCPRCGTEIEAAAYGVKCGTHRCDWHRYRTEGGR